MQKLNVITNSYLKEECQDESNEGLSQEPQFERLLPALETELVNDFFKLRGFKQL